MSPTRQITPWTGEFMFYTQYNGSLDYEDFISNVLLLLNLHLSTVNNYI